jgi:hypothetical protein
MNDSPAPSIAFWFAAEIIPASATTVTSVSAWALMNAMMVGSIVAVSARLPSNASTISGNPAASVSSPIVICGSRRRSLREPRLAEPLGGVGLEVQRGHVVEHQARRPEPGVRSTCGGQAAPPGVVGITLQPALERRVGDGVDPGLGQHPQAVVLTGRLDDPGQHQLPEHLVSGGGGVQAELLVGRAQRVPQRRHPGRGDRQRPRTGRRQGLGVDPEVELALPTGQPLPRDRLERLHRLGVMGRTDVLDVAGSAPGAVHDLHRGRTDPVRTVRT